MLHISQEGGQPTINASPPEPYFAACLYHGAMSTSNVPGVPDCSGEFEQQSLDWTYKQTIKLLVALGDNGAPAIDRAIRVFGYLERLLPQTVYNFGSGHDFPIRAAHFELQNSVALTQRGMYRYAFIALRSALELGLISAYYNRLSDAHDQIQSWLQSTEMTPHNGALKTGLLEIRNMPEFDKQFDWFVRLSELRGELNKHTHSMGYDYSSSGSNWKSQFAHQRSLPMRLSFSGFAGANKLILDKWLSALEAVVKTVAVPHVLLYPIAMHEADVADRVGSIGFSTGTLDGRSSAELCAVFDSEERSYLQSLCAQDADAAKLLTQINSLSKRNHMHTVFDGDKYKLISALHVMDLEQFTTWLDAQGKRFNRAARWSTHDMQVLEERVQRDWVETYAPERIRKAEAEFKRKRLKAFGVMYDGDLSADSPEYVALNSKIFGGVST